VAGKVTTGLMESNGGLPPVGWLKVTCRLTACTLASALGPALGKSMGELYLLVFICIQCFDTVG